MKVKELKEQLEELDERSLVLMCEVPMLNKE